MVNWNLQNKRKAVAALETCGRCINALILLVYSIFGRLDTRHARRAIAIVCDHVTDRTLSITGIEPWQQIPGSHQTKSPAEAGL